MACIRSNPGSTAGRILTLILALSPSLFIATNAYADQDLAFYTHDSTGATLERFVDIITNAADIDHGVIPAVIIERTPVPGAEQPVLSASLEAVPSRSLRPEPRAPPEQG